MKHRHDHQWREVRRVYLSPALHLKTFRSEDSKQVDRVLLGVTSVELRCGFCGDVMERQLLGDHT